MVSHGVCRECPCKVWVVGAVHQPFLNLALLTDASGHRLDRLEDKRGVVGSVRLLFAHWSENVPLTTVTFQETLRFFGCCEDTTLCTAPKPQLRELGCVLAAAKP